MSTDTDTRTVHAEPDAAAEALRSYGREHIELVHDDYLPLTSGQSPLAAMCYPLSEAWYHIHDCEHEVYCLSWNDVMDLPDGADAGTHWYLRDPDTGDWIDLTLTVAEAAADGDDMAPYGEGRRQGFLTGDTPSTRANDLIAGAGY
jgi:hypothetical protein